MRHLALRVLAPALLVACAAAQATLYSPPWLAAQEGASFSHYLGRYPDMRYQMVDGDSRGQQTVLNEIAMRLDYRQHSAVARRFGQVTIELCDGDLATFGTNFTANRRSAPTSVFSAAVSWPQQTGLPPSAPAAWGGLAGEFRFPFTTSWSYGGKLDILSDWTLSGGTLLNNAPWGASSPQPYYFDSYGDPSTPTDATYRSIPAARLNNTSTGVTGRCNDSAWGAIPTGSYGYIWGQVHGAWTANAAYRGKLVMYSSSYYTAPSAPVLHAWGLASNDVGVDIGTGCNRLHITGPLILQGFQVPPISVYPNGYSGYAPLAWPWLPGFANLRITMQAAWTDSVTGRLNLTQAREATLPASGPAQGVAKRSAVFSFGTSGPVGPWTYEANPALRYR